MLIGLLAGVVPAIRERLEAFQGGQGLDTTGFTAIGFLLAFLLVFKTQTAYKQFWTASPGWPGKVTEQSSGP